MRTTILFFAVFATLFITLSSAHRDNEKKQSVSRMGNSDKGHSHGVRSRNQKRKLLNRSPLGGGLLGGGGGGGGSSASSGTKSTQRSQVKGPSAGGGGGLLGGLLGGAGGVGI